MDPIVVRPYRPSDMEDLRRVYLSLYDERDSGEFIGMILFSRRPSLEDDRAWFERAYEKMQARQLIFLVAEVAGHAVGNCQVERVGPSEASEDAHVGDLGILVGKEMRGKGVGTALLERALAEASSVFEVVYLSVFSENTGAQRLYERFGFEVCGRQPRMVKRGGRYFDEVRMVRFSSPPPP